jgi:K+-sensing histidine kinase KdpD
MLFSVVGSLLENAFRFTQPRSEVTLTAYSAGDHILIDVEDNCGGLLPGAADKMFVSPRNAKLDRPAFRYGLPGCRHGIEASGGTLKVRDIPGMGCVFTIALPRAHPQTSDAGPDGT